MIPINEPYADGKCVQSSSGTTGSLRCGFSVDVSDKRLCVSKAEGSEAASLCSVHTHSFLGPLIWEVGEGSGSLETD